MTDLGAIKIITSIDGKLFADMIISASNNLNNNKNAVDKLNVFPVPDGDTGTNMSLTFTAAADEIKKYVSASINEVAKTLATSSLRGARGNSGVILSQFCRGLSKELANVSEADAKMCANAMKAASETAYRAVMRPTEGTILTVSRKCAEAAVEAAKKTNDVEQVLKLSLDAAQKALDNTPNQLPVLKEAGVVDAGGAGLVKILEGAYKALSTGELVSLNEALKQTTASVAQSSIDTENIKFSYCTEFIINKKSPSADAAHFSEVIDPKGDCKLVIDDDEIVKVHIHTNHPGFVIEEALRLGALERIKIDNMKIQHTSILESAQSASEPEEAAEEKKDAPHKKYGFVSIAAGEGIANIFRDYGVDEVIEGGQTMNPSTDDILNAAEKINADHIFILPNNKNIILAANQASELSEKDLIVIPTKNIPQGISAVMAFLPHIEKEDNLAAMNAAIENVRCGQITYAVRDTVVDGNEIKSGDIIALGEGKITSVSHSPEQALEKLADEIVTDDTELLTVYYGEDVSDETADEMLEKFEEKYGDMDVIFLRGAQPLYYYIISAE